MRVWHPIPPFCLDRKRLLGEHRELHAIFSILLNNKTGYRNHPEVKRWQGRLTCLFVRHSQLVKEMQRRGYKHKSNLPVVVDNEEWPDTWEPIETMRQKLADKINRNDNA